MIKNISTHELLEILKNDPDSLDLIDVREPDEYAIGHIKNAKLIPMREIMGRSSEIDWDKKVVLYCRTGHRSAYIATIMGPERDVWNLAGGIVEFGREPDNNFIEN